MFYINKLKFSFCVAFQWINIGKKQRSHLSVAPSIIFPISAEKRKMWSVAEVNGVMVANIDFCYAVHITVHSNPHENCGL